MKTQKLIFPVLFIAVFAAVTISMKSNSGPEEMLSFVIEQTGEATTPARILNAEVLRQIPYPYPCRELGIAGEVKFKITVDETGQVKGWKVLSTPHKELSKACFKQLKKLQFNPALDNYDIPMASWIKLKIKFEITS